MDGDVVGVEDAGVDGAEVERELPLRRRRRLHEGRLNFSFDWTTFLNETYLDVYRVSHPIIHEVSSCFVLGVSLPCLGSS